MTASEDLVEMHQGIDSGEKTAIQPSSSLSNEVGHLGGHVGLASCTLDVLQDPVTIFLGYQLEAQDSVFSKVHVGSKDAGVCAMHLLTQEIFLKRSIPGLVILQCKIPVSRESAWKYGYEPKDGL